MSLTFPTEYSPASLVGPGAYQFNVVFTYNIAGGNVREAVDLAFSAFSDQSGGYVEVFEEASESSIIEGDMADFPKLGLGDVHDADNQELTDDGSDITDWDQFDVVFTYNTAAASAEEAFKLAVSVASERSGGYIEAFCNGDREAVFESDLPMLHSLWVAASPAP
jgi:hypothetical protein